MPAFAHPSPKVAAAQHPGVQNPYDPGPGSGSVPGAVGQAASAAANAVGGLLPNVSFLSALGSLQLWKGVGLILAGVLILILAALELRKVA